MELLKRPKGLIKTFETVMSNFDHEIDQGVVNVLLKGKHYSQYSAQDFCGYIYYVPEEKVWRCEIWQHNSYNHLLEAESLRMIMDQACERFGCD